MPKRPRAVGSLAAFVRTLEAPIAGSSTLPEKQVTVTEAVVVESTTNLKRQKVGLLGPGWEKYDATALVPHYTSSDEVPEHLKKYFFQRKRYFSRYDEGCLLDEEGWYSVTPEKMADQIAERCRCDTVLDAFCGVGGNAIAFAKTCNRVIALDTSPVRLSLARHNAIIYGVADRIEFILADYLEFARTYLSRPRNARIIDVVFLSPPWGGPSYISSPKKNAATSVAPLPSDPDADLSQPSNIETQYDLSNILPIHGAELFHITRRITPNVAYFLPRNVDLVQVGRLLDPSVGLGAAVTSTQRSEKTELVEVEEEYMSGKLKAVTCYFGGLVDGQGDLFD